MISMYVKNANISFDRLAQANICFSDTDLELTHDALPPLIFLNFYRFVSLTAASAMAMASMLTA